MASSTIFLFYFCTFAPSSLSKSKGRVDIVTLKNIADACGVSVSTVSRAFDKQSRISQPVRQQILSCASEMGYTPNLIARSLKSSKTKMIALIIPSIDNRFYIEVLKHLEITLHQHGYRLLVSFVQEGIATERECIEMMISAKVDAIVLITQTEQNRDYIFSLREQVKIIQLFGAPFDWLDSVVMDDNLGAQLGTEYLIHHNHHRILFTGGEDRLQGLRHAIVNSGISPSNVIMLPWNISPQDVCDAIHRYHPTAIFSVAYTNEAVWTALQQLNLKIPDDISWIAYDNTKWIQLAEVCAVAHNLEEITSALVKQLISRLDEHNDAPPKHIVLEPFIIERKSVSMLL